MPSTRHTRAALSFVTLSCATLAINVLSPSAVAPSAEMSNAPVALVITGSVSAVDRRHVLERTFVVAPGTRQLDIAFEHSESGGGPIQFDLGLRSPDGVRGWSEDHGHSIHIDDTSASYGYLPGRLPPGTWAVLVGVATVPSDPTSFVLRIRTSPVVDAPRRVLRSAAGWYAGDLHTHSGHSDGYHAGRYGGRVPVTVSDIAAAAVRERLDFVAISDHNTSSHWIDVDRVQAADDRVLLLHARELTTYEGHFNAIGERRASDLRLAPDWPMPRLMRAAAADGSFLSINHPWLPDDEWCAGCGWSNGDRETINTAHAIEIANGTTSGDALPGWRRWADLLNRGHRLVAVGGSDVHALDDPQRHLGEPTTVVYAASLSEDALVAGLKSGRVYGRAGGPSGPALDLEARVNGVTAVMGQTMPPGAVRVSARIQSAAGQRCEWIVNGRTRRTDVIASDRQTLSIDLDLSAGDWISLLVKRGQRVTAWSNAIYVEH